MVTQQRSLNLKLLKEQVYEFLKEEIREHRLKPGSIINLDATSKELGISRTPLRDALMQLAIEGFVSILPRRGVFVNIISRQDIREFYQVIGILEYGALMQSAAVFTGENVETMARLSKEMRDAVDKSDYQTYMMKNTEFHNVFIHLTKNDTLITIIDNLKRRLYDFPKQEWTKEWELIALAEHDEIVAFLRKRQFTEAANVIQNKHWSFEVQEPFIKRFYAL